MKWNFPILKSIKNFYKKHGLIKTIPYIVFIAIGLKVVVGNITILIMQALGYDVIFPGPFTRSVLALFGVQMELDEVIVLKQNLKEVQKQLQESYKRVDELIKEINELKTMAEKQRRVG